MIKVTFWIISLIIVASIPFIIDKEFREKYDVLDIFSKTQSNTNTNTDDSLDANKINQMIEDYIKDNPVAIIESLERFQESQYEMKLSATIDKNRNKLFGDKFLSLGNKDSDNKVAKFFDFHCGYCGAANDELLKAMKEGEMMNFDFSVTLHPIAIFGKDSEDINKYALVAYFVDSKKYKTLHNLLFDELIKMRQEGKNSIEIMENLFIKAGYSKNDLAMGLEKYAIEIEKLLEDSRELADSLGVRGTPAYIVNNKFVPGVLDKDSLLTMLTKMK